MSPTRRALASLVLVPLFPTTPVRAAIFGVQTDTDSIVEVDPATGAILRSFTAPDPAPLSLIGLSGAENGSVLLWTDSSGETTLARVTRIDPVSGAVLDYHDGPYLSSYSEGLTSQRVNGVDYVIVGGRSDGILVQHGYDSHDITNFAFETGANVFSLGGDGFGRSFAYCSDHTLREFDPLTGTLLHTLPFLPGVSGLAFDGQYLYATNVVVQNDAPVTLLYTLDSDTAEILHSAPVSGGRLAGLAAAVPEPSLVSLILCLPALFRRARHRVPQQH